MKLNEYGFTAYDNDSIIVDFLKPFPSYYDTYYECYIYYNGICIFNYHISPTMYQTAEYDDYISCDLLEFDCTVDYKPKNVLYLLLLFLNKISKNNILFISYPNLKPKIIELLNANKIVYVDQDP